MSSALKGIVISGPTAVGKTDLSIKIAKLLNSEIISADSSQIYKHMNIGTAKITFEDMGGIRHHMLDIIEPGEDFSVGDFEIHVNNILKEKEKKGENIVVTGGTGLYIRAVTDGFSKLPSKDEKIRKSLSEKSTEELSEILKGMDYESFENIDLKNRMRVIRAIEVCILTNGKFSELKTENIKGNSYKFLKIFLTRDREELYERINKRVDIMISRGFEKEASEIYEKYKEKRHKIVSIGYREFFKYFNGELSLEETVEEIKKESRRYAKRQLTWFRKEKGYITYNLSEMTEEETVMNIMEMFQGNIECLH